MSGTQIAAEIAAALGEAGEAVGSGALACTLRRLGSGPSSPHDETATGAPAHYPLTGIDDRREIRDASGSLTGRFRRTLTINATGEAPVKSDLIAVGVALADVDENTVFSEIEEVRPFSPGGVVLLYEVDLVR